MIFTWLVIIQVRNLLRYSTRNLFMKVVDFRPSSSFCCHNNNNNNNNNNNKLKSKAVPLQA
jgi:hypothetical protein